jgi:hypothetical protein
MPEQTSTTSGALIESDGISMHPQPLNTSDNGILSNGIKRCKQSAIYALQTENNRNDPDGESSSKVDVTMDLSEDSQSSNIIVTPDIGDFASYAHDDSYDNESNNMQQLMVNEQLERESLSESVDHANETYNDEQIQQPNIPLDADKLYSAYSAYAAAAAAAASLAAVNSGETFASKTSDDSSGCRNLLCDSSGVIIAETVYRCLICRSIHDSITDAQVHYLSSHAVELGTVSTTESHDLLSNLITSGRPTNSTVSNAANNVTNDASNSNLLSQLLRGDNQASTDSWSPSMYANRPYANLAAKSQLTSQVRQQMLLKQQRLKAKSVQQQHQQQLEQQLLQQHRQLNDSLKQASEQAWLQRFRTSGQSSGMQVTEPAPTNRPESLSSKHIELHNQLIQSSLAEMLQNGGELPTNNENLSESGAKSLALRFKGINNILTSSVDNSPVSQEEFAEEYEEDDDEQMQRFSPQSDTFEQKSDDSLFDSTQQSQFGYIPEMNPLFNVIPRPGTVAKSK